MTALYKLDGFPVHASLTHSPFKAQPESEVPRAAPHPTFIYISEFKEGFGLFSKFPGLVLLEPTGF